VPLGPCGAMAVFSGARTMDEMKDGASSWAHEVKSYEMEKRRVLEEGFLRPPAIQLTAGKMKSQERVFDPLLQRYRDNETEYKQRVLEETERVNHLNRAMDIQVLREQPHHILHHESKFDKIAPGQDPTRQPHRARKTVADIGSQPLSYPVSQQDYNIVSNLPYDVHHWNRPEARPRCTEKEGSQRKVHASRIRDFNIVTNRYPVQHEKRTKKEKELTLAEATHKFSTSRKFDTVTQQFNDPRDEENAKHCDDARDVEVNIRAENMIPPSYKGRHTEFYNAISNEVHDPPMLTYLGQMEAERKDRYKNRYIVEHNFHAQDVKGDHLTQARKLNKVAPERFMEHDRGYCMITNKLHGNGAKEQVHYGAGYPQKRKSPWEEVEHGHSINGRSASTPALPSAATAEVQRSVEPSASPSPAPGRSSRVSRSGAPSQASNRSQTLSEAGGRAMSNSGSTTSAAQYREPPGATRPIPRAASTPNLAPVSEMSSSAVRTRKLPPPTPLRESMPMDRTPLRESMPMTRAAPPAPAIPGSPLGSVYSRPSAKC